MNDAIQWLYHQHVGTLPQTSLRCYLCGDFCAEERYPQSRGLAETFNSHYLARCPSSAFLCAACAWYFDNRIGHPDFRKMSLIVAEKAWHNWRREDMKMEIGLWLSHGLEADAYLVVSLSKKKHVLLQAPLNSRGTRLLAIQVEEQVAHVDQSTWQVMNRSFMRLIELGHNKGEILSGNLYGNTLRKHGQVKEAMSHSQVLEPYRSSPQIELLSYVTIVDQESEKEERDRSTERDGGSASVPGGVGAMPVSSNDVTRSMAWSELGHMGQAQKRHLEHLRDTGRQRVPDDIQLSLFPE